MIIFCNHKGNPESFKFRCPALKVVIWTCTTLVIAGCSRAPLRGEYVGGLGSLRTAFASEKETARPHHRRSRARVRSTMPATQGVEPLAVLRASEAWRATWTTENTDFDKIKPNRLTEIPQGAQQARVEAITDKEANAPALPQTPTIPAVVDAE